MTPANPYAEVGEMIALQGHVPPQEGGSVECECKDANACLAWGCARDQIVAQYERECSQQVTPADWMAAALIGMAVIGFAAWAVLEVWPVVVVAVL